MADFDQYVEEKVKTKSQSDAIYGSSRVTIQDPEEVVENSYQAVEKNKAGQVAE